jgi:eukaryotic-like serine/threonine-protein kinase
MISLRLNGCILMTAANTEIGSRLGSDLTVLGVVDDRGEEPVYLVWHHKSWCPMLCKVLQSKEAAQREAEILQALAHPHIVRCFGMNGSTRVLMEYIEGPSLHQLAQGRPKRRLGIHDALRISIYVGAALSHVHDRGLLHLDVKPSNIVVVRGRPILCDFGIARWQAAPRPNGMTGTEGYAAPEECLLEKITPAADIFGLGVTLYELLTGTMPFPKKTVAEPYPQILRTPRSVRDHRAAVPIGLEKLVLSCLNHDPKERPSLAALLPSLHRYIGTGPSMWPSGFNPEIQTNERHGRTT